MAAYTFKSKIHLKW